MRLDLKENYRLDLYFIYVCVFCYRQRSAKCRVCCSSNLETILWRSCAGAHAIVVYIQNTQCTFGVDSKYLVYIQNTHSKHLVYIQNTQCTFGVDSK